MNYIDRLQGQVAELRADHAEANECIIHLLAYLSSSKFHDDPTVQVADIVSRIAPARLATMSKQLR
tara:strand:+ start:21184 stop:21381 length:198 start_codon:yes stop_codon:yes gene_type:complete